MQKLPFSLPIALTPKKCALIGAGAVAWQKFCAILDAKWSVYIFTKDISDSRFAPYFAQDSSDSTQDSGDSSDSSDSQDSTIDSAQDSSDSSDSSDSRKSSANPKIHATIIKIAPNAESIAFLRDFEVVIDASGDENLGAFLHSVRKKYGFLLNVVDKPALCDFYFGAIVRRGNLAVMVSTNGASPTFAQIVRDKIAKILPNALNTLSIRLKIARGQKDLQKISSDSQKITRDSSDSRESSAKITRDSSKIPQNSTRQICQNALGKVFIIGCGPGDFELLTLKAIETLEILDIALIDNLVGREIWEFLEARNITCIDVGKKKGAHKFKQSEINQMLLNHAREGKIVGRLKGGDPVIFGRVWEEASFLHTHNIEVEYISGITSALCGALQGGITPTLRGVSSGALIVSAHLRESIFHVQWLKWLKNSPYTIIVLMAHSFAERIKNEALAQGISPNLPAAFISQISLPSQKTVLGTLRDLPQMAQMCENPSILILGKAVEKSREMPYFGERIALDSLEK